VSVNLAQTPPEPDGSGLGLTAVQQDLSEPAVGARAQHSRFVSRVRRRDADRLNLLAPGAPTAETLRAAVATLQREGRPLDAALRIVRRLALERLAVLDVECGATLEVVTGAMTSLAEVALDLALAEACAELDGRHGVPRNAHGRRIDLWIVGMGKLGARELNVSSDIDLVYVYGEEGLTDGRPGEDGVPVASTRITAHEYFTAVARRLYALIGDVTDEGFVFRVDLALRPNGMSGPPVVSLAMLEEYFQSQGREWERFAWLKSRIVAPLEAVASGRALALRPVVTSFVYRRYLDYGVFEGLRQLHRKVRQEAQRRAAGRPERANDVKLSRGGIREIEFIVQLMLVVRGGQFPEMRTRSTLKALDRLAAAGLMKPANAQRLGMAYRFLRRVEHRIQYLDDQQTHLLPTDDADLAWIARSLDLPTPPGGDPVAVLLSVLGEAREFVAGEFDALLHDGRPSEADPGACRACGGEPPSLDSDTFLAQLPGPIQDRVRPWLDQPRLRLLRDESKQRLARLIGRAARAAAEQRCTPEAAVRFVDWLEPLLRRESYLALLVERPAVHERLLRLLGLARWPMRYLIRHPGVIDELADERQVHARFDAAAYIAQLQERHAAWERSGQASEEFLLDTLRRAHHAEVFRILVRDVEGLIEVEQVADDLSALADATLQCAIDWAWPLLRQRHRERPSFAVVAYGKLGGKELGYGSDLDLVFVYDDEGDDPDRATEAYGAFVRKLITWLTLRTATGELFDIDTALRPNGSSGLLVTSLRAFEHYQAGRGSNTAWTWEHQAITRARFAAGDDALAPRLEAVRRQVLCAPRDPAALRSEVAAMRQRVRDAHPVKAGLFDLKHSPGGMIDAEFAVQYLVLTYAAEHAELQRNAGNIALLRAAEAARLVPPGVGSAAADAYRELRRAQHRARLDEQPTSVPQESMARERQAVEQLWHAVFG
jgi:glutamate-ammonia-ligase adenylyltransferase